MDFRRFSSVIGALALFTTLKFVRAAEPTDWFHDAKWGVMTHYLGRRLARRAGPN